jgi:hypothetical protein
MGDRAFLLRPYAYLGWRSGGGAPLLSEIAYDHLPPNDNTGTGVKVHVFDTAQLVVPSFTVQGVRVEVAGALDVLYIGAQAAAGDAYDAVSLTQLFFSGSPGVSQGFDATTLSDFADFTWDKTANLLTSHYNSGGRSPSNASAIVTEYNAGALLEAETGQANKSAGYNTNGGAVWGISKIILYGR